MKLQAQIEALESLAALDETLTGLESELSREGEALAQKKSQIKDLEGRFQITQASVSEMERMRGELLQDARHMSLQMDRSREKLARSRTEREVNASQREIEELRKLYRDRELEIEKINGLAEQARLDMEAVEKERKGLLGELGADEPDQTTRMSDLERGVAEQRSQRKALAAAVPKVLYRRYELVRKRRGSAVAWTVTGTCSACHIAISPMMFQKMRRGEELDQCPSCQRILYFREEAPPEQPGADGEAQAVDSVSESGTHA